MDFKTVEEYQEYVKKKVNGLTPVFARASIGDFTQDVQLPEEDDEFTQLYVGIQVMVEVIREQINQLSMVNQSLQQKLQELERLNRTMVGRELKMIELKKEIKKLKQQLGQSK